MTQTIGFIGMGPVHCTLARLSVSAGYHVLISTFPCTSATAELHSGTDATPEKIARESDLIVLSIPFPDFTRLSPADFIGKVIVDTTNYFPCTNGIIPALEDRSATSSELIQRFLKGSLVVKALNNLDHHHLGNGPRPAGAADRWALPVSSNDAYAKARVFSFLDRIGFDAVDNGSLADSWRMEAGMPVYVLPYIVEPPAGLTDDERRTWFRAERIRSVPPGKVRTLLARATHTGRVGGYAEDLPSGLME
ncbi:NADPH-dependent F420 reductase [Siphonobacter aquaeclarae]|uniref:Pyrroline-5-carboxylate reductase catalytic N-terminal domain-containing protein n=1 Tax=Siphonobacter aquaeclarae TaxID=563176 RepID=A0A1G9I2R8_9BACT|nr:NAD(P)-binding domain-containing protein [Siphonobacter aquaeclarae]SDL19538.1 hypothetical protein SAMN04488090_0313 [Siphonobacter aquaeclarae]